MATDEKHAVNSTTVRNSVVAGYAAGVSGVIAGHPLDSMKVWLQTGTKTTATRASSAHHHQHETSRMKKSTGKNRRGIISTRAMSTLASSILPSSLSSDYSSPSKKNVVRETWSKAKRLHAGITGPLLSVGVLNAIKFATYDSTRRTLYELEHPGRPSDEYINSDSMQNVAIASVFSGTVLSVLISPMLLIKTKQQTEGIPFRQAITETLITKKDSGNTKLNISLKRLYTGFVPHYACETVGKIVYFVTYEQTKRWFQERNRAEGLSSSNTLPQRMVASVAAGTLCWAVIFPGDSIRSQLYAQEARRMKAPPNGADSVQPYRTTWEMTRHMYNTGGWRSFYKGYSLVLARAGPVAAVILPIYDITLEKLNRWSA